MIVCSGIQIPDRKGDAMVLINILAVVFAIVVLVALILVILAWAEIIEVTVSYSLCPPKFSVKIRKASKKAAPKQIVVAQELCDIAEDRNIEAIVIFVLLGSHQTDIPAKCVAYTVEV